MSADAPFIVAIKPVACPVKALAVSIAGACGVEGRLYRVVVPIVPAAFMAVMSIMSWIADFFFNPKTPLVEQVCGNIDYKFLFWFFWFVRQ